MVRDDMVPSNGGIPADRRDVLAARRSWREYGHLHTHPSNGSFSDADIRVLLSNRELRAVIAVGIDGRWHIMSRSADRAPADPWDASGQFALHLRQLLKVEAIPMVEMPHAAWSSIAYGLGLRYDRVEGRST